MIFHRYSEIDPAEQKMHADYIREHADADGEEMRRFYIAHFSSMWS